jgi:hypothetical protein
MQSLVGYELVKVLVTFGLQPITLSDSLKEWSPDLYDIFSNMQTKKSEMKENTLQIVHVLFNQTVHTGQWNRVQLVHKKLSTEKLI